MKARFDNAFLIIEIKLFYQTFYQFYQTSIYKKSRLLRIEEIEYFDLEYQDLVIESIVNVNKYVYY